MKEKRMVNKMTNELKIEIIKRIMVKAKKDIKSLNQKELGVMTKLSYGAKLDDFSDKELEEVCNIPYIF